MYNSMRDDRQPTGFGMRSIGSKWLYAGRLTTIVGCIPLLSACATGILEPQGPIGAAEKSILIDSVAIMLAIVAPTIVAIFGFAWWFRASNARAHHLPDWAYSGRIELVVWAIPALVVMLLGGVAWIGSHDLDPAKPIASSHPPLEIQVVSLDWKWLFLYPDQKIATVNALTVPVGVPVHFSLTSASVMNAFFIPQLGSMIYTMNGMTTRLNHAVPAKDFADWVQAASKTSATLDARSYAELAKQTVKVAPADYRLDDPDLFQSIATQKIAAGPGPQDEQPTSAAPRSGGADVR